MCTAGDSFFTIDIETLEAKLYKCKDCNNDFKAVGIKVVCPSCHSSKVSKIV